MADDLLDPLITRLAGVESSLRLYPRLVWATVAASAPLRVIVDGDDTPIDGTPSTLVKVLIPGERVRCELQGRRLTVLAVAGRPRGIPEGTTAQRNALSSAGVVQVGTRFWCTSDGREYRWTGTVWDDLFSFRLVPRGCVSVSGLNVDPTGSNTLIPFGAADFADGITWSNAGDIFTIQRAGWYRLSGYVIWNNDATANRLMQSTVNGAASQHIWNRTPGLASNLRQDSVGFGQFAVGDTIGLAANRSSSAGARVTAAQLSLEWIRD